MSNTPTILVTADFSDCSPEVVRHAGNLARRLGGKLTILHVVEVPSGISETTVIRPTPEGSEVTALAFLEERARDTLAQYAEAMGRELGGVEVDTEVAHGPIVEAILASADALDAQMIVMGTHGRHGLPRLVLGSVAERVIRAAERPVLTLRSQHKPTCEADNCAWCSSHVSWAQSQLRTELDG